MVSSLFFVIGIISVLSDTRNFYPEDGKSPSLRSANLAMNSNQLINENALINTNRVWVHLNSDNECFPAEQDVRAFKDYLLSQYECISFNTERKKIYKHPVTSDYSVWSLWFELNDAESIVDFECLQKTIDLPPNIPSSCIDHVYYEPMQEITSNYGERKCVIQDIQETNDALDIDLWSLDILDSKDSTFNKKYNYPSYGDGRYKVEAIVLDQDVDAEHEEFSESDPQSLFTGTLPPTTPQFHATHVAGTLVGKYVGGAKKTKLRYYPVCQFETNCAWSDIEAGYETAIEYMNQGDEGTRYVINYSASYARDELVDAAYEAWGVRIRQAGGIWVTSAGNRNTDACLHAPNFSSEVVTVAAYGIEGGPAFYTSFGDCVDVWGPGGDKTVGPGVWSAKDGGGYQELQGTSMASPNIASIIVNLLKMDNTLNLNDIKEYMKENARNIEDPVKGIMNQAYLTCKTKPCSTKKQRGYDEGRGDKQYKKTYKRGNRYSWYSKYDGNDRGRKGRRGYSRHYGKVYSGNTDTFGSMLTAADINDDGSTENSGYLDRSWFIVIAMFCINIILFWYNWYSKIVMNSKALSMEHKSIKIDVTESS